MPNDGLSLVQQLQALIQAVLEALSRSREIIAIGRHETSETARSEPLSTPPKKRPAPALPAGAPACFLKL